MNGTALSAQPVVSVTDSGGNVVAGVTVTATLHSGSGSLTGATAVTNASGVATFSGLTLTGTAGSFTLTFTAGASSATSSSFTPSPPPVIGGKPPLTELTPGGGRAVLSDGTVVPVVITNTGSSLTVIGEGVSMMVSGAFVSTTLGASAPVLTADPISIMSGSGYWPGTTVLFWVLSRLTTLGSTIVKPDGTFTFTVVMPASILSGSHTMATVGIAKSGSTLSLAVGVVLRRLQVHRPVVTSFTLDHFSDGSWTLTTAMKQRLTMLALLIRTKGAMSVAITSYSDAAGASWLNLSVSRERAVFVESFLRFELRQLKYVQPLRFAVRWFGQAKAVANNRTAAGRAANRRVVIETTLP